MRGITNILHIRVGLPLFFSILEVIIVKKITIILIIMMICTVTVDAVNFEEFAVDRVIYVSKQYCKFNTNILSVTYKQAVNRIEGIKYWSNEFNYMFPMIHPKRIQKDLLAVAEHESHYLNWASVLDDGNSFGMFSLQWDTAKYIADINNWELNKIKLQNDPYHQAKYAVWYYYYQLKQKGNRYDAIMAYNSPSIRTGEKRWRRYFMNVLGIITYHDKLLQGE